MHAAKLPFAASSMLARQSGIRGDGPVAKVTIAKLSADYASLTRAGIYDKEVGVLGPYRFWVRGFWTWLIIGFAVGTVLALALLAARASDSGGPPSGPVMFFGLLFMFSAAIFQFPLALLFPNAPEALFPLIVFANCVLAGLVLGLLSGFIMRQDEYYDN